MFVVVVAGSSVDRRLASLGLDHDPDEILVERQRRDARGVRGAEVARLPSVGNELVVERGRVSDDVAANALDAGRGDLLGENVHRFLVVPEARAERRIADAAKVQVAGEHAVGPDGAVAQRRSAEREVGPESIERDRRRVHLHCRRGLHHRVGILLVECVAARERDDDRAP